MTITHQDELEALRRIGRLVANTMHSMAAAMEPGMTTREQDGIGRELLERDLELEPAAIRRTFEVATAPRIEPAGAIVLWPLQAGGQA